MTDIRYKGHPTKICVCW